MYLHYIFYVSTQCFMSYSDNLQLTNKIYKSRPDEKIYKITLAKSSFSLPLYLHLETSKEETIS